MEPIVLAANSGEHDRSGHVNDTKVHGGSPAKNI